MRYFRLKKERRWKICHAPRVVREKMVNQAKFCTRLFVDAVDLNLVLGYIVKLEATQTVGPREPFFASVKEFHVFGYFYNHAFYFPHFSLEARERFLVCNCAK